MITDIFNEEEERASRRLEDDVLDFITHHREGVKITRMEKRFRETRMRIGYITQKLVNEGKILRIHDDFFPAEGDKYPSDI